MLCSSHNASARLGDRPIARETLGIELERWIDFANQAADKAVLAKSMIAPGNHGCGVIASPEENSAC
jgi:hypothetical protein